MPQPGSPDAPRSPSSGRGYYWTPVACDPAPPSRSRHASCSYAGTFYVHGGKRGSLVCRDLWCFRGGRWQRLQCRGASPPSPHDHSMVAHKGRLYVFGGEFNYSSSAPLWILDLDALYWERHVIPSEVAAPLGRRGHSAVICHSAMHIFGGYVDLSGSSGQLWTFDLESSTWHLTHDGSGEGPGGRHYHSAVIYDGSMYVFGGLSDLQTRDDFWRWNFAKRRWQRVRTVGRGPPPIKGHCACCVNDTMLLYGGAHSNVVYDHLWVFRFSSRTWSKISARGTPPSPLCHLSCLVTPPSGSTQGPDPVTSLPQLQPSPTKTGDPQPHTSPAESPSENSAGEAAAPRKNRVKPGEEWIEMGRLRAPSRDSMGTGEELPLVPMMGSCKDGIENVGQGGESSDEGSSSGVVPRSLTRFSDDFVVASELPATMGCRMRRSLDALLPVRSISRDDLILEDIEDSDEDVLDNSRAELLMHDEMAAVLGTNGHTNLGSSPPSPSGCQQQKHLSRTLAENSFIVLPLTQLYAKGASGEGSSKRDAGTGSWPDQHEDESYAYDGASHSSGETENSLTPATAHPAGKVGHLIIPSTPMFKQRAKSPRVCSVYFIGGADGDWGTHTLQPLIVWKLDLALGGRRF